MPSPFVAQAVALREAILENLADTLPCPEYSTADHEPEIELAAALSVVIRHADAHPGMS